MTKIRMVETQPPPNFHAAAPANNPRNGPSISSAPRAGFCRHLEDLLLIEVSED
ncbi:MAG: hypothetical protein ABJB97_03635 [Acidobacteriota bacterium]